ncbi:MAG: FkbM family methyltransferase [Thermoleophilaceae bacterium]
MDLLPRFVHPGDSVIDVGANFGAYSYHLSLLTGDSGRVFAFEAAPDTSRSLRRVLASLGVTERVEVVEKAVGDRSGTVSFVVPRRSDGSADAGRAAVVMSTDTGAASSNELTVPLTRLDDEIPPDREVSFIKIDIEGADLFALRGAETIIARSRPPVLIEVAPRALARHGLSGADIDSFLEERGYTTYRYESADGRLIPAAAAEISGDLLAIHGTRTTA